MLRYALTEVVEELLGQRVRGNSVNAMFSCPLHEDRVPSLAVHLEKGIFQCFSCSARGDLNRLALLTGGTLGDDLRQDVIIRSTHSQPKEQKNFAPLANQFIRERDSAAGNRAIAYYLRQRPVCSCAIEHFGVGWNESRQSLSFPYWSDDGAVRTIKYRGVDGRKSYETGSGHSLYNLPGIRGKSQVVLCEGESDTHSAFSALDETFGVAGSPGASVSESTWGLWSLDLLFAKRVYVAFDADDAGDKGVAAVMSVLGDRGVRVRPTMGKDISGHLMNGGTLREIGVPFDGRHSHLPS